MAVVGDTKPVVQLRQQMTTTRSSPMAGMSIVLLYLASTARVPVGALPLPFFDARRSEVSLAKQITLHTHE